MIGWRGRLPGALIRGEIAWLAKRVDWIEEGADEQRWLTGRTEPMLQALEGQVVAFARRELSGKGR